MLSTKRKALDASLQRRVRARRESSGDVESVASDLPSDNIPGSDDEDNSDSGDSEEEVCPVRSYFRTPLTLISV
jgi:ribosomal RNA-processing protein 36